MSHVRFRHRVMSVPVLVLVLSLVVLLPFRNAEAASPSVEVGAPTGQRVGPVLHFGAGVWHVPNVLPVVRDDLSDLQAGTLKIGIVWEILAPSTNLSHLRARLESYRLNAFLRAWVGRGGEVVVSIDGMPRWLAADRSGEMMPDGPRWAKSPPSDFNAWSQVVAAVVGHFNNTLGLDAYFEVWNEPDWSYLGDLNSYFRLYTASVLGARSADPNARIGGPGLSDWGSAGIRARPKDEPEPLFLQKFLRHAATTGLPELGYPRLPVDFVSWHAYYQEPGSYYTRIAPRVRDMLAAQGYARATPLILDEWNVAAEPPYPEGDLNGGAFGAAFVAASLIRMQAADVDRQVFQLVVDPGTEGYSGGVFTPSGLPRANLQAFRLADRLRGTVLETRTSHRWLHALAARDGGTLRVLVASLEPTPIMATRPALVLAPLNIPGAMAELQALGGSRIQAIVHGGQSPPAGLSAAAREALDRARADYHAFQAERGAWRGDGAVAIRLPEGAAGRSATVYSLDADAYPSLPEVSAAEQRLRDGLAARLPEARTILERAGANTDTMKAFMSALQNDVSHPPAVSGGPPQAARAVSDAYQALVGPFLAERDRLAAAWSDRAMTAETVPVGGDGVLRLGTPPHAIKLIVVEMGAP